MSLRSTQEGRGQNVLDEQIHTVFEISITESDLAAACLHYTKAKWFLGGATPDYENAAKEAVASVEALATAMTGERDLPAAIRKATRADLIPRPLDELIIKLYACRGNEPGVSHGQADLPEVTREDAEFVFNLAGSIGSYLRRNSNAHNQPAVDCKRERAVRPLRVMLLARQATPMIPWQSSYRSRRRAGTSTHHPRSRPSRHR